MKKKNMHPLLQNQENKKLLMLGNEAIARGALEAGVAFASAYPGTPSSEIALQFFRISLETATTRINHSSGVVFCRTIAETTKQRFVNMNLEAFRAGINASAAGN